MIFLVHLKILYIGTPADILSLPQDVLNTSITMHFQIHVDNLKGNIVFSQPPEGTSQGKIARAQQG